MWHSDAFKTLWIPTFHTGTLPNHYGFLFFALGYDQIIRKQQFGTGILLNHEENNYFALGYFQNTRKNIQAPPIFDTRYTPLKRPVSIWKKMAIVIGKRYHKIVCFGSAERQLALLRSALCCIALRRVALLCFALLCFASLSFALLCVALLCFALF